MRSELERFLEKPGATPARRFVGENGSVTHRRDKHISKRQESLVHSLHTRTGKVVPVEDEKKTIQGELLTEESPSPIESLPQDLSPEDLGLIGEDTTPTSQPSPEELEELSHGDLPEGLHYIGPRSKLFSPDDQ